MKRCAIFDVDGTLSDPRHRLHLIQQDPKDWGAFFAAAPEDPPRPAVVQLARVVAREMTVVVVTGRPRRIEPATAAWLRHHGVPSVHLYTRADDDRRPGPEYKLGVLEELRRLVVPVFAIDDDPRIVEAFRAAGLETLACPSWGDGT